MTDPADFVLTGGRVQTHDAARSIAEATAIRRGRIAGVGTARDLRRLVGARTRVIDRADRMVLPGSRMHTCIHRSAG